MENIEDLNKNIDGVLEMYEGFELRYEEEGECYREKQKMVFEEGTFESFLYVSKKYNFLEGVVTSTSINASLVDLVKIYLILELEYLGFGYDRICEILLNFDNNPKINEGKYLYDQIIEFAISGYEVDFMITKNITTLMLAGEYYKYKAANEPLPGLVSINLNNILSYCMESDSLLRNALTVLSEEEILIREYTNQPNKEEVKINFSNDKVTQIETKEKIKIDDLPEVKEKIKKTGYGSLELKIHDNYSTSGILTKVEKFE